MEKNITILTRKVSWHAFLSKFTKNTLRFILTLFKSGAIDFSIFHYYGHTAVTRSLAQGLKKINYPYKLNPLSENDIGDTVCVLSDVKALEQAVQWKKDGKISRLIAGPNILEIPNDHNSILASPEIDLILVSAQMSVDIYQRLLPQVHDKIFAWYSGIDIDYWDPGSIYQKEKKVLAYWKNAPIPFSIKVENLLKKHGYEVERLVYGKYSKNEFRNALLECQFSVFLSITETQGLALAESWAMNVPTIVWDPEIEHYYLRGIKTTSCPYLTQETGMRFKEISELDSIISAFDHKSFSPRNWTINNMSDESSSQLFVQLINKINTNDKN